MPKRARYRQYDLDPDVPVPRSTMHRKRVLKRDVTGTECQQAAGHRDAPNDSSELVEDAGGITNSPSTEQTSSDGSDDGSVNGYLIPEQGCSNNSESLIDDHDDAPESPLHPDSPLTRMQSIMLIMAFVMRHGLSDKALDDLLNLINLHFPNSVPATKYHFYKSFGPVQYQAHYYCKKCMCYLGMEQKDFCARCSERPHIAEGHSNFFYTMALEKQIISVLKEPEVARHFETTCFRKDDNMNTTLTGITDGLQYKQLLRQEVIRMNDLTLLLNTDGISVFKSSNFSVWPILATINEIPKHLRKANILMAGLWFGKCKPNMNTFLKPLTGEMQKLGIEGLLSPDGITNRKVFVLGISADAPARAIIRNSKQYNGAFGCDWCLEEGTMVPNASGPCTRRYPFNGMKPKRTDLQQRRFAVEAEGSGECMKGVKGCSATMVLPYFDCVGGMAAELQHGAFLGVVRQFICSWLDGPSRSKPFYVGHRLKELDKRLLSVSPPTDITRTPRSFRERKYWKASEWRAALFYSPAIFQGILPSSYLSHWFLFVNGLCMLMQDAIAPSDLVVAENCLFEFVRKTQELYGTQHCTYNLHIVLHYVDSAKNLGPLHLVSTFLFEGFNRTLFKLFQGTQSVPQQICETFLNLKSLLALCDKCIHVDTPDAVVDFCATMLDECLGAKHRKPLGKDFQVLGRGADYCLTATEKICLHEYFGRPLKSNAKKFCRFAIGSHVFSTISYSSGKKHCNSWVSFMQGGSVKFASIECLLSFQEDCECVGMCLCGNHFAVMLRPLVVRNASALFGRSSGCRSKFYWQVTSVNDSICISPESICAICIEVSTTNNQFILQLPSKLYWD